MPSFDFKGGYRVFSPSIVLRVGFEKDEYDDSGQRGVFRFWFFQGEDTRMAINLPVEDAQRLGKLLLGIPQ